MTLPKGSDVILRRFLYANALFSAFSGLSALFAADSLAPLLFAKNFSLLGLTASGLVLELGIGLLIFAGLVCVTARRETLRSGWVKAIIIADILWVLESAAVLALFPHYFSAAGVGLTLAVALIVLLFAAGQAFGLNQMRNKADLQPA